MSKRNRVLVSGPSLSYRNTGDNLLYFSVGKIVTEYYDGNVEISCVSSVKDPERINAQAPWLKIINPRRRPIKAVWTALRSHVYFIAGAIPFHDNTFLMLQQLGYAVLCKLTGGKVIVNAVSVQPIRKPNCRWIFRMTARVSDWFTVRDAISAQNAKDMGVTEGVQRAADPGMIYEPAEADVVEGLWRQEGLPEASMFIGIAPHYFINKGKYEDPRYDYRVEYGDYSDEELDGYYQALAEAADELSRHGPVIFYSLSTEMPPGDDRVAAEWIVDRMAHKDRAHIIRGQYNAAEMMGLLGRLSLFISTRLHGYALGVGNRVPSIAIEFHPKMRGMAEEMGIDHWVLPLRGLQGEALVRMGEKILKDPEESKRFVSEQLEHAREKADRQIRQALSGVASGHAAGDS